MFVVVQQYYLIHHNFFPNVFDLVSKEKEKFINHIDIYINNEKGRHVYECNESTMHIDDLKHSLSDVEKKKS
jgi:hypothetical protein